MAKENIVLTVTRGGRQMPQAERLTGREATVEGVRVVYDAELAPERVAQALVKMAGLVRTRRAHRLVEAQGRPAPAPQAESAAPDEPADDLDSRKVVELKELAKARGIKGWASMTRQKLIEALRRGDDASIYD